MSRYLILGGVLGGLALAGAGAFWFRSALNEELQRGQTAEQADMQARLNALTQMQVAASEAAFARSNRDILRLEQEHDQIQDRMDELEKAIGRGGNSRSACLGADVVRALARIGRPPGALLTNP